MSRLRRQDEEAFNAYRDELARLLNVIRDAVDGEETAARLAIGELAVRCDRLVDMAEEGKALARSVEDYAARMKEHSL
jgi:hypothetical protein